MPPIVPTATLTAISPRHSSSAPPPSTVHLNSTAKDPSLLSSVNIPLPPPYLVKMDMKLTSSRSNGGFLPNPARNPNLAPAILRSRHRMGLTVHADEEEEDDDDHQTTSPETFASMMMSNEEEQVPIPSPDKMIIESWNDNDASVVQVQEVEPFTYKSEDDTVDSDSSEVALDFRSISHPTPDSMSLGGAVFSPESNLSHAIDLDDEVFLVEDDDDDLPFTMSPFPRPKNNLSSSDSAIERPSSPILHAIPSASNAVPLGSKSAVQPPIVPAESLKPNMLLEEFTRSGLTEVSEIYLKRFANAMKSQPGLDGRKSALRVLLKTMKTAILKAFISSSGFVIFCAWLQSMRTSLDQSFLGLLLRVADHLPLDLNSLKASGVGKPLKPLKKLAGISDEAKKGIDQLIEKWKKLIPEPVETVMQPSSSVEPSKTSSMPESQVAKTQKLYHSAVSAPLISTFGSQASLKSLPSFKKAPSASTQSAASSPSSVTIAKPVKRRASPPILPDPSKSNPALPSFKKTTPASQPSNIEKALANPPLSILPTASPPTSSGISSVAISPSISQDPSPTEPASRSYRKETEFAPEKRKSSDSGGDLANSSKKRKTVRFKPDHQLVEVKFIENLDDLKEWDRMSAEEAKALARTMPPVIASPIDEQINRSLTHPHTIGDAKDLDRSEGQYIFKRRRLFSSSSTDGTDRVPEPPVVWTLPPTLKNVMPSSKPPIQSNEVIIQEGRERGVLTARYFDDSEIPSHPSEEGVDLALHDPALITVIPLTAGAGPTSPMLAPPLQTPMNFGHFDIQALISNLGGSVNPMAPPMNPTYGGYAPMPSQPLYSAPPTSWQAGVGNPMVQPAYSGYVPSPSAVAGSYEHIQPQAHTYASNVNPSWQSSKPRGGFRGSGAGIPRTMRK